MVKFRLHEEGEELDRRIDLVNVVFGAALGGYIGVVMTQRDLDVYRGLVLSLLLIIVVCMLVAIRNLIHILRGTRSGSWKIAGGDFPPRARLLRIDPRRHLSRRRGAVPIAIGWLFAFVVVVSSHVIICKETENERILHH